MIEIKDHYFAAWLVVVHKAVITIDGKKILVSLEENQKDGLYADYKKHPKPIFDEVRKLVKELRKKTAAPPA